MKLNRNASSKIIHSVPNGFTCASIGVGIKKKPGELDLALINSSSDCTVSATFTKNSFCAAPVKVSRYIMKNSHGCGLRALVVNSGCANACTGDQGDLHAWEMVKRVDNQARCLVMSTGVIGQPLPIKNILHGIDMLNGDWGDAASGISTDWNDCAKAFMTTDTFPKISSRRCKLPSLARSHPDQSEYTIIGIAKGAGMIHPNMATMLGGIFTDIPIEQDALDKVFKQAVNCSFNAITIDGDTSTNDTALCMANHQASLPKTFKPITINDKADLEAFGSELNDVCKELAKMIVEDGEGATKFVEVCVNNAKTPEDARKVAESISTSSLVKTAIFGQDANWGRIVAAIGNSGADIKVVNTDVYLTSGGSAENQTDSLKIKSLQLVKSGQPFQLDENVASQIFKDRGIQIKVDLKFPEGYDSTMWTCDLSVDYVNINADYRS